MKQYIENHPVYKQVLNDSFGGIMYTAGKHTIYDSADIIIAWDNMSESDQNACGGIMKGAMGFLKGD